MQWSTGRQTIIHIPTRRVLINSYLIMNFPINTLATRGFLTMRIHISSWLIMEILTNSYFMRILINS